VIASLAERGGRIESVQIDGKMETPEISPRKMELQGNEVEELLGFKLTNEDIISCLKKIRYGAEASGNTIKYQSLATARYPP